MNKIINKMIIVFLLLGFSVLYVEQASAQRRVALVIGNSSYDTAPLANPVNDAADMAASLKKLGFIVILKTNANQETMESALEDFGNRLKKGGVGLFYYAGHGMQVYGSNYLIPVGAKLNKESDIKYRAVNASRILDEMDYAGNGMNIVILDACRDNPFGRSFRSASRGLSIISSAPRGTFITYSTSPGNIASDGKGRNSPYTKALLKHMTTPGLPIEHVFKKVRQDLSSETKGQQIPWELSSLSGDFYFNSDQASINTETEAAEPATPDPGLEEERRKLAEEREKLRREAELLAEKNALAEARRKMEEERRKLEEEKQRVASLPTVNAATGTGKISFLNATVADVKFFESGYDLTAKDQRVYRTGFSKQGTRYVAWELDIEHPAPGYKRDFVIEGVWFNQSGLEIWRQNCNTYVMSDWTNSQHALGYGSNTGNYWTAGTYRVDLYVEGVKVASQSFNIY